MQNAKDSALTTKATQVVRRPGVPGKDGAGTDPKADQPRVGDPAMFIGKEVTIYSPPHTLVTQVYSQTASRDDRYGELACTVLDIRFGENGELLTALVQWRPKGSRRYYHIDHLNLEGCAVSLTVERDQEEEGEQA